MSAEEKTELGNPTGSSGVQRFIVLDGLRGIAAFAVILDHVYSPALASLMQGTYLAVDFFFVLSGFVLAHAYQSRLEQGMGFIGFMRLRFIRLYPMYLLGFALGATVSVYLMLSGQNETSWQDVLFISGFSVLFLPTPRSLGQHDLLYPFNAPSWTLLFELVANLIYSLFARLLTVRILFLALPLFAVLAALTIPKEESLGAGWTWSDAEIGFIRVMFGFFVGVLIYKLRDRIRYPSLPPWGAALFLLAVLCFPAPEAWRRWYDVMSLLVLMPMVLVLSQGAAPDGWVANIATRLGVMSYGIYVLHQPIFQALEALWRYLGWENIPGVLNVAIVAFLAGSLSWVADRLYDRPVRRVLSRYLPFGRRKVPVSC